MRQNSRPFSAMMNASNWLTSDLEAVFDHQSLPYKMTRHFSSSFWSWSDHGKGVKFATYYDTYLAITTSTDQGVEAGPGVGLVDSTNPGRGDWLKSKSLSRLPSIEAFSRTSGRGSGRPSVLGLRRCPPRKSSSMNLT